MQDKPISPENALRCMLPPYNAQCGEKHRNNPFDMGHVYWHRPTVYVESLLREFAEYFPNDKSFEPRSPLDGKGKYYEWFIHPDDLYLFDPAPAVGDLIADNTIKGRHSYGLIDELIPNQPDAPRDNLYLWQFLDGINGDIEPLYMYDRIAERRHKDGHQVPYFNPWGGDLDKQKRSINL